MHVTHPPFLISLLIWSQWNCGVVILYQSLLISHLIWVPSFTATNWYSPESVRVVTRGDRKTGFFGAILQKIVYLSFNLLFDSVAHTKFGMNIRKVRKPLAIFINTYILIIFPHIVNNM
jgi:hypothetical protein